MTEACASCQKAPPAVNLKNCAKCKDTLYCSRDCQKNDWKTHKKVCGKPGGTGGGAASASASAPAPPSSSSSSSSRPSSSRPSTAKGLDKAIPDPFTRLQRGTWLHDRPEIDVYRLLVDAYRLRLADDLTQEGKIDPDSIYGSSPDGLAGFQRFLGLVAARRNLLPAWWDDSKKTACEQLGTNQAQWNCLRVKIEKSDIMDHYGNPQFPMQLRMLAEAIYQRGPGGASGRAMMGMMASMEQGGGNGMHMSHLDVSRGR